MWDNPAVVPVMTCIRSKILKKWTSLWNVSPEPLLTFLPGLVLGWELFFFLFLLHFVDSIRSFYITLWSNRVVMTSIGFKLTCQRANTMIICCLNSKDLHPNLDLFLLHFLLLLSYMSTSMSVSESEAKDLLYKDERKKKALLCLLR